MIVAGSIDEFNNIIVRNNYIQAMATLFNCVADDVTIVNVAAASVQVATSHEPLKSHEFKQPLSPKGTIHFTAKLSPMALGHEWIGQEIIRSIDGIEIHARVTAWAPAVGSDLASWHVVHNDGDENDLNEAEMLAALKRASSRKEEAENREELRWALLARALLATQTHKLRRARWLKVRDALRATRLAADVNVMLDAVSPPPPLPPPLPPPPPQQQPSSSTACYTEEQRVAAWKEYTEEQRVAAWTEFYRQQALQQQAQQPAQHQQPHSFPHAPSPATDNHAEWAPETPFICHAPLPLQLPRPRRGLDG
eukprot:jgi/Chrpa1/12057/Chrysochromulina_OHIO_Genome00021203-RA